MKLVFNLFTNSVVKLYFEFKDEDIKNIEKPKLWIQLWKSETSIHKVFFAFI